MHTEINLALKALFKNIAVHVSQTANKREKSFNIIGHFLSADNPHSCK